MNVMKYPYLMNKPVQFISSNFTLILMSFNEIKSGLYNRIYLLLLIWYMVFLFERRSCHSIEINDSVKFIYLYLIIYL